MRYLQKYHKKTTGFTAVEVLIALSITVLIFVATTTFGRNVFSLSTVLRGGLDEQFEARKLVKDVIAEIRRIAPADNGAYPLADVSTSTITFYIDLENDGTAERVRYFLDDTILYKGVITPSGDPVVYNEDDEIISPYVHLVVNSSVSTTTPIFEYFDKTYTGASTSLPLSYPLSINEIRNIRVTFVLDKFTNRNPGPLEVTSHGTIRNLRDDL